MLKLKLQYFGHLMWRTDSIENTLIWGRLKVGGEGDDRGWDGWMASPTQWTWVCANFGSWWWTGKPSVLQSMGLQRTEWLNWTEVCHSSSSREQMSFNFKAAINVHSDFGTPQNSLSLFPFFLHPFAMKWWDWMHTDLIWHLYKFWNNHCHMSSNHLSTYKVITLTIFLMLCIISLWLIL